MGFRLTECVSMCVCRFDFIIFVSEMLAEWKRKKNSSDPTPRITVIDFIENWERAAKTAKSTQNNQNIINLQSIFYTDNRVFALSTALLPNEHRRHKHAIDWWREDNDFISQQQTPHARRNELEFGRQSFTINWSGNIGFWWMRTRNGNNKRSKVSNSLKTTRPI